MAINTELIPSVFTNAEDIGWILCGQWGTGGTTALENSGNANRPLNRIFGNTTYLKLALETLEGEVEDHIVDENAHWESIRAWMDYPSDEYNDTTLPGDKVKDSLSIVLGEYEEDDIDNRIENAQVSDSADIAESKINLSLREKQRSSQESGYFNTTGDLADDINTLFNLYGGSKSAFFDSLRNTIKSIVMSGWVENYPHVLLPMGENSVKSIRETLVLNKDKNTSTNLNLHGIPVVLGNTGSEGNFEYPVVFSTDNLPFYFPKSSNIYTATDLASSGRKDLVFLEMWIEDIETKNDVALYGDVMCGAFDWFFNGTDPDETGLEDKFRYFHSGTFLNTLEPEDSEEVSNPDHLVFSDSTYQPIQVRFRIIVCENTESMEQASPQAILPLPVNRIEEIAFESTSGENVFELANEDDTLTLFTGNKVVLTSGSWPFTCTLGYAYVDRVSDTTIRLAETLEKCVEDNSSYFYLATSSIPFSLKCYTGESETIYTIIASSLAESDESVFTIDSESLEVVDESAVRFDVKEENFNDYLNFEFDVDKEFVRYFLTRESDNNFSLWGVALNGQLEEEEPDRLKLALSSGHEGERLCGRLTFTYSGKQFSLDISPYTYNSEIESSEFFIIDNRDWDGLDEIQVSPVLEASFYIHSNLGEIVDGSTYYCDLDEEYSLITLYSSLYNLKHSISPLGFIHVGCDPLEEEEYIIDVSVPIVFKKSEDNPYEYSASINLGTNENYGVLGYPLFKISKRNAGIYHPTYNPNGSAIAGDTEPNSIANCFDEDFIVCYKADSYDILNSKTIKEIKDEGYTEETSTNDCYILGGVKYYRTGYLAEKTAGEGYFGISGRPDGLFYNSIAYSDIVDLRHKVNCSTDLNQIINRNLDSAFRGGVVEEFNVPTMSDGVTVSGVNNTTFLQRDIIRKDISEDIVYGNVIDEKIHKIVDGEEWVSFDGIDGIRRVWSDEAVEQTDSEVAMFGNLIVPEVNVYGDVFENFTGYERILENGGLIDIDYTYYKYVYFDGETPAYKYAFSGVRVYRVGGMSGDYYGSSTELDKRRVSFSDENSDDKWGVYEKLENRDSALEITSVRTITANSNISFECSGYTFDEEPSGAYKLYVKNNSSDYVASGFSIYTTSDGNPLSLVSIVYDEEYSTEYVGSVIIGYYRDGIYTEEEINIGTGGNYDADMKIIALDNAIFTDYTYVSLFIPRPNETALVKVNPFRVPKPLKDNEIYRVQVVNADDKKIRLTPFLPVDENDYIEFEPNDGYIDVNAMLQLIPQPVIINSDINRTATIKLTESVDVSAVTESTKTVPLGSKWLTGTPVRFDNLNWFSEDFSTTPNQVFYLILKNQELGEYILATSAEAAIAYLRKVDITSIGTGSYEMYPVNNSENINTRIHRALLIDTDSFFDNSFRSSQDWETGNPIHIQSFDDLVTPQHQFSDPALSLASEVSYFVPVDEVSEYIFRLDETGSYTESVGVSTVNGDCFFALPAGNDIPTGFIEGKTYYVHVTGSTEEDGTTFYLSDSFFSSLLGRKTSCGGVVSEGKLAISPCKTPENERILLSAGGIDTQDDSILVSGEWETGMCVSVSPYGNTHLPSGLSLDNTLFVEKVGDGKIKLIQDFKRYFSYKIGEYEGMTNPFDVRLSDEEEVLLEDYFDIGSPRISHFERSGDTIYGGYTFTELTGVEIHGENLSDVTSIRIGNHTITSGFTVADNVVTLNVPAYAYDSLVEVSVKSGGIWSNTLYYMYFSATVDDRFYLFHITPSANSTGLEEEISIYCYYNGDVVDIATDFTIYSERYGVRNTNLVDGELAIPTEMVILPENVKRITDSLGYDTPIIEIKFSYTPPDIESTVGDSAVKQSITDFSIYRVPSQTIVSRNTLSFSSFVIDNGTSFPFISHISTPKDTEFPKYCQVPFGSNSFTNRVRIIMNNYTGTSAVFEVTDANDQWTEIVTGYRTRENLSGTLTDVFYIELPRKIAVGNVNVHLVTDEDVFCEVPYLNSNSPVVFESSGAIAADGTIDNIVDFYGYGLDTVNKVFLKVFDSDGVEQFYHCSVSIIDKDDNRITVLIPRIYAVDGVAELKFVLDFISYDSGTASVPFELGSTEYCEIENPSLLYAVPPSISCEADDEYPPNYVVTKGTIDVEIFGERLQYIEEVELEIGVGVSSISLDIVKKETDRIIVRIPQIVAGDEIDIETYSFLFKTVFAEEAITGDVPLEITFVSDPIYDISPFITSVSSYTINNYEETVYSIYGNNLTDVTSVQVGSQSFDSNQVEVIPGISEGLDQLVITLVACDDSGIVPVSVTTLYGETTYLSSYSVYVTQIASPYVDFRTSGVGEIQLVSQTWEDEAIGSAVNIAELDEYDEYPYMPLADTYNITQNLPTGLPVSIGNKDYYVINTNLAKFNLIDFEGNTFAAYPEEDFAVINIPQVMVDGTLEDDDTEGIGRYIDVTTGDYTVDNGTAILLDRTMWNNGSRVALHLISQGFPPTEEQIQAYMVDGEGVYNLSFVDGYYYVKFASTMLSALSDNPLTDDITDFTAMTMSPSGSKKAYGMFDHYIDEDLSEGSSVYGYLDGETDVFIQVKCPTSVCWMTGVPVKLGSSVVGIDGSVHYNVGDSSNVMLSKSIQTISYETLSEESYGFIELKKTWPDLKHDNIYYVENVGSGRIRVYDSAINMVTGNYLVFKVNNESSLHFVPIMGEKVIEPDTEYLDTNINLDEIYTSIDDVESGSPVRVTLPPDAESTWELPGGLVPDKTYYVYKSYEDSTTETCGITLFENYRDALLLEAYVKEILNKNISVTMDAVFEGASISQELEKIDLSVDSETDKVVSTVTVASGDVFFNSEYADPADFTESLSLISGVPVKVVSNLPILEQIDMENSSKEVKVKYTLCYEAGRGLTDRPYNSNVDNRLEQDRQYSGDCRDKYIVLDNNYASACSMSGFEYWNKNSMSKFLEHMNVVTGSDTENFYKAYYNAIKYTDIVIPAPFNGTSIPTDKFTLVYGVANEELNYEGGAEFSISLLDYVPPYFRDKELYVNFFVFRTSDISSVYGIPSNTGDGTIETTATPLVSWNKTTNTVQLTGIPEGSKISFRMGITVIEAHSSEPGVCQGSVFDFNAQTKEISHTGVKRILLGDYFGWGEDVSTEYPGQHSWDDTYTETCINANFRDVLSFSGTIWNQEEDGSLTLMHSNGGASFVLNSGVCNLDLGQEAEFLYVADSRNLYMGAYDAKVAPPKEDVTVYYMRNVQDIKYIEDDFTTLVNPNFVVNSCAGSKASPSEDNIYQYPYLLFSVPTINKTYTYSLKDNTICDATSLVELSYDSSFLMKKDITIENSAYTSTDNLSELSYLGSLSSLTLNNKIKSKPTIISLSNKSIYPDPSVEILPYLVIEDKILYIVLCIIEGNIVRHFKYKCHGNIMIKEF